MYPAINEAVQFIRKHCRQVPAVGLILGSGLGACADSFANRTVIPFRTIPHFPISTVPGHSGNLVIGEVEGSPVVAMQGRLHLYEGYSAAETAFPVRVLGCLGISHLIVTNSAGGVHSALHPGEMMLITDHINMMGVNPLTGANLDGLGPRFPDMTEAYDITMRTIALEVAREKRVGLREGIYAGLPGPSYETPAEIRMCRALGADAVGMSTIPEVIVANHMGMRVLGISCITNMAAGILPGKLAHEEVMQTAEKSGASLLSLLQGIIPRL